MKWTRERVIPWNREMPPRVMCHHVMRYAWAMRYVAGKRVVDLGCGTGYGSFMLSWVAGCVLGVDSATKAVLYAQERFRAGNLAYVTLDIAGGLPLEADVYVAFEVLEHLDNPQALIAKLDAPLVWSVPIESKGPFHKHVYSLAEIRRTFPGACAYQTYHGDIGDTIPDEAENGYVLGYDKRRG